MLAKDVIEVAAHVAEVVIALIAVSPFLHKAIFLLRTDPTTADERLELVSMYSEGRMGEGQWAWVRFLWWCRGYSDESLTWREWRARHFICPTSGHRFGRKYRPADMFQGVCDNCHLVVTVETAEALERIEGGGKSPWSAGNRRTRPRNRDEQLR